jgi:Tfp pilus assembly protein PilV
MRTAVSLVEVIVGLTILTVGVFPVLRMMSGTRGMLAQSQEMLLLQGAALAGAEEARSMVRKGWYSDLSAGEEEFFQVEWGSVQTTVHLVRDLDGPFFQVTSHSAKNKRYFILDTILADPAASCSPAGPGSTL